MKRNTEKRRPRVYSLGVVLLMAAPPCQETNPDFGGPAEGGDTDVAGTTTTTGPGTDAGPDTGADTAATGDGTTAGNPGTTGDPPATTGAGSTTAEGSTSSTGEGSTGGCTMCGAQCVDTQTDPDHCGECNNKCNPAQEQCVDGMCVPN